jgi:hypothetical protein
MLTPDLKIPRSNKQAKQQAISDMKQDADFDSIYLNSQANIKRAHQYDFIYLPIEFLIKTQ